MSIFLTEVDAWMIAVLLGVAMLAGWAVAWWSASRLRQQEDKPVASKFHDAILALLGLLLAFTFSMALGKHDQRREMVVTDSNAIGDFYTCASLLNEPERGKLRTVVRRYLEHRLSLAQSPQDEATFQRQLAEVQQMHGDMEALVRQAVDNKTPVVVPLVNTLNALTSSHASRVAAYRDRLPPSIVLLLFLAAVVSMVLMGWQQGVMGERRPGAMLGFIALVCMVVWVTLDLNQPRRGWITVSQEPLQRLLTGMEKNE